MSFPLAGPEGDEEPSGEDVLRLIQIRLATPSVEKLGPACQQKTEHERE
jgi:hypothetical protein